MTDRFDSALADTPEHIATFLKPILTAPDFDATLSKEQFEKLQALSGLDDSELRVALLPFAAAYSYAPISEFFVGAIVRGLSGRLYFGANMEIIGAQLGQTVHAEQSAISHAWMKGETGLKDITINYSPCGHCRQFMNELTTADSLVVQLPQRDEMTLQEYLPESFGPKDLGITDALMSLNNTGYQPKRQTHWFSQLLMRLIKATHHILRTLAALLLAPKTAIPTKVLMRKMQHLTLAFLRFKLLSCNYYLQGSRSKIFNS